MIITTSAIKAPVGIGRTVSSFGFGSGVVVIIKSERRKSSVLAFHSINRGNPNAKFTYSVSAIN